MTIFLNLPMDVWSTICQHLNHVDKVKLFWFLWKAHVIKKGNLVEAFQEFAYIS